VGKGAKKQQLANSGTAQGWAKQYAGNAGNIYGSLAPELQNTMVHPAGIGPTDMAAINTAGMQSAGGTEAAAVGQGALRAARTRNLGGSDAATASGVRSASENLGKTAVGAQLENAKMKESQRRAATSGLEGLYGSELGASMGALGLSNQALNDENHAPNFWQQAILQAMSGASQVGAAHEGK
jgi:hypothetical protein